MFVCVNQKEKEDLHVESDHLRTVHPRKHWLVVCRSDPCALRIHSQKVPLCKPVLFTNHHQVHLLKIPTAFVFF
jgi:hypothetical protein